ncbi:hypothetical protein [Ruminococcus albus]|uniref:hypothetical protein n=1 Tax=Ruminococcus albus TaxID=1264 RepID=UPI0004636D71|nr:hypothetical protein [Ruminococcus albus]
MKKTVLKAINCLWNRLLKLGAIILILAFIVVFPTAIIYKGLHDKIKISPLQALLIVIGFWFVFGVGYLIRKFHDKVKKEKGD